ncbi:MAG: hypothetical protein QNJ51_18580 [Calothrix sp. MO_167.B12]|nr:hypothetical protein [Calothrix sp. MO_167.B12]
MASRKPNAKNTKAEILQAYEELLKEKAALKSQINQKIKPNSTNQTSRTEINMSTNQPTNIQQKMNFIIDGLAKIQLGFGSAASELSEQLSTQASKLAEIQDNIANEVEELKNLHNLEISENTLDSLIQAYEDNSKVYQSEFKNRSETLLHELQTQSYAWQKEQEEYQQSIQERNDNLHKNRQRDAAEYKYDLELQRKLEMDKYQQQQKELYKQLDEYQQEIEKQWAEREKTIATQEEQYEECKSKVELFPKEKEAAIKKATEQGKGIAHYQAKVKSDLYAKEVEGQKRFYEQRLQSLEATITNQETRITNLSTQLESALKQVQDLAVKAIEGSANVNSYQAMKEIALEQAKGQSKTK